MVRRDEPDRSAAQAGDGSGSRCTSPAGASPVPVGVGAPGSRPQPRGRDPDGRAGCQKGPRTERARGPQHEVKSAASKDRQSGSRAAHLTAKATVTAQGPKRAGTSGGVRDAAREQGEVRNTGDPSAWPSSGQGAPYKPKAKSAAAQRESEGVTVPKSAARAAGTNAAQKNVAGGIGPCGGHVGCGGTREGMIGATRSNHPRGQ